MPQGSILGTLLFSIFIDDLVQECENEMFLFADDSTLFGKVDARTKPQDAADSINRDLMKIKSWADSWKVVFEPAKCQAMVISHKRMPSTCELYYGDTPISLTNKLKILGVTFDPKIAWNKHVLNVSERAGQKLGGLCKVSGELSVDGRPTELLPTSRKFEV